MGRESIEDNERVEWPSTSGNTENVSLVYECGRKDHRKTLSQIVEAAHFLKTSFEGIHSSRVPFPEFTPFEGLKHLSPSLLQGSGVGASLSIALHPASSGERAPPDVRGQRVIQDEIATEKKHQPKRAIVTVSSIKETDSLCKKMSGRPSDSEEAVERAEQSFVLSPRKSTKIATCEQEMPQTMAWKIS
ncbi:hypothetical protein TNCV_3540941 [Trichonephila clavipes]|nr:hypothetical protein TNCV_3540941 [Trichonephila clavipes]